MPGMPNEELARLLQNMIRLGTIVEVDHVGRVARVQTGGLTTNWLKWHTARAGAGHAVVAWGHRWRRNERTRRTGMTDRRMGV